MLGDIRKNISLEYKEDGVLLCVNADKIDKRQETEIILYLKKKQIKGLNSQGILNALYKKKGTFVKIAEFQEEQKIDSTLQFFVSKDKMQAKACLLPPDKGKDLTLDEAYKMVNMQGIKYGLNDDNLRILVEKKDYNLKLTIAEGVKQKNGTNSSVDFLFTTEHNSNPKILEDGSVDYKHLSMVENVTKDQVLARITPATKGENGKDIYGNIVKAIDGKNVLPPLGKNTLMTKDDLSIVAATDGKAELIDGRINVYSVYQIESDVDNSTGNIDFIGNVVINGNVLTGFSVKAGGYIEVKGVVEGAYIEAKGDVVLKKGIQGRNKGVIRSDSNVISRFIENAEVYAHGSIITETIMHSNVKCNDMIRLGGKKGLIVGGTICAGRQINASVLGSQFATSTSLEVGVIPKIKEEYKKIQSDKKKCEEEIYKSERIILLLNRNEQVAPLDDNKKGIKAKAIKTKIFHKSKLPELNKRLEELDKIIAEASSGTINVEKLCYPGVNINIGNSVLYVKENIHRCTFRRVEADIKTLDYEGE